MPSDLLEVQALPDDVICECWSDNDRSSGTDIMRSSRRSSPSVLVTGATGLVGTAVVANLETAGLRVRAVARHARPGIGALEMSDTGALWHPAVRDIDVVVHLAARVHVMDDRASDPLSAFRAINCDGTLRLARHASDAGCRRFVFVSTVKILGERTTDRALTEEDVPDPDGPYAVSKLEAEMRLLELQRETGIEVTIVRPPLVYGPGVRGNFMRLWQLVAQGIPLPLGGLDNRRSLVGARNLASLIRSCVTHPAAADETFLVSDQEDISTSELAIRMAAALERPSRLIPVPATVVALGNRWSRTRDIFLRLFGSFRVDSSKASRLLDWVPETAMPEQLAETAEWYRTRRRRR